MTMDAAMEDAPTAAAPLPKGRALALRLVVVTALGGLCVWLVAHRFADTRWSDVSVAIAATPWAAILLALLWGAVSHVALACYDGLAFRQLGRAVPPTRALSGGFAGTVVGQVLGFGLVTGSLARARMYRGNGIRLPEAVALSGLVSAGFFTGLAALLCVTALLDPSALAAPLGIGTDAARIAAGAALLGAAAVVVAARSAAGREIRLFHLRLRAPDRRWLAVACGLAAADLVPAALCLYVLLPPEAVPSIAAFVGVYVVAVALGHLLGSPGAVGPFEGVMFLALPHLPAAEVAAAILVYRAVYYLPPFALALVLLARAKRAVADAAPARPASPRERVSWILDENGGAEGELAFLGDKQIFFAPSGRAFAMYAPVGRLWLMMGDPQGPAAEWGALVDALESAARAAGARVAVYKASAAARDFWAGRGRVLQPVGEDAVLDPQSFTLDTPARRELRRKVAGVRKAGLEIAAYAAGEAPMAELEPVAAAWRAAKRGREQTFSMGHWSPGFVARHPVFVARVEGRAVAFLTCWVSGDGREWMLDLMRQVPDAPNGAMHALMVEAIAQAAAMGATRFNLCTAPLSGLDRIAPVTRVSRMGALAFDRLDGRHGLQGLRRFKEMFRPDWSPRYVVASGPVEALAALAAAARLVRGAPAARSPHRWTSAPRSALARLRPRRPASTSQGADTTVREAA